MLITQQAALNARLLVLCDDAFHDAESAQNIIAHGKNIDAHDEHGSTALCNAVSSGNEKRCQRLLDMGANPDLPLTQTGGFSRDGHTPLHLAAQFGHIACALLLIKAGANINLTVYGGSLHLSALFFALRGGYKTLGLSLIAAGANPALTMAAQLNRDGVQILKHPLHEAVKTESTELCLRLLERGYDPLQKNAGKKSVVQLVREFNRPEIASLLGSWLARKAANHALQELTPGSALRRVGNG